MKRHPTAGNTIRELPGLPARATRAIRGPSIGPSLPAPAKWKARMKYALSVSYGNDSIAMIQWAHERGINAVCVYIDTGWAGHGWLDRVAEGEKLAQRYGFEPIRLHADFAELMRTRKGFPSQRYQWCSGHLKGLPFLGWLEDADPDGKLRVMVGKRRSESAARRDTPFIVRCSDYHGGRPLIHPLYRHTDDERNALLHRAGFDVLPHRSRECDPCINANRADFRALHPLDVAKTAQLEHEVGKTMFRPARHNGAKGIEHVVRWAKYSPGKYEPDQGDLFETGCGSPFGCGL